MIRKSLLKKKKKGNFSYLFAYFTVFFVLIINAPLILIPIMSAHSKYYAGQSLNIEELFNFILINCLNIKILLGSFFVDQTFADLEQYSDRKYMVTTKNFFNTDYAIFLNVINSCLASSFPMAIELIFDIIDRVRYDIFNVNFNFFSSILSLVIVNERM